MFDFLRNLTKSAEEKRQEAVAAYVDEALSGRARQQFEQEMAQDDALRQEVAQLRVIKQSLRQLPQREVPRNFILDPAKYGRPAQQPWVRAYPVLRAATAMTAFFLIFAFAAGIFTNQGAGELATSAPAADVAQVESTSVVTEETEAQAFEAAEEEAMAEEAPVDESTEEGAAAFEAEAEEPVAEMAAEEEMADEEAEAPPAPEATAVSPIVTDSIQEETTEDGATVTEPLIAPTPTPSPIASPTPTVSTLPRVTPPTPLPDRDTDQLESDDTANEVVADVPETAGEAESVETTADLTGESGRPFNPLLLLQIGLGVLLLVFAGLTFYARRQR